MTQNACYVQGVQGLCRHLCRVFHSCAGCAGSFVLSRACARRAKTTPHKRTHARIYTRHTRHTRHMLDLYTYFHVSPGTGPGTSGTRTPNPLFFIQKKKMDEKARTRTIRCTPDNAREMQQMVKAWPELHALVQNLQAQGMFPGLRALSVTLTGPEIFLAKGVAAVNDLNAPKRD